MESRRENRYRPSALCRWWLCRGNRRTGLYRRTSLAGTTQGKKHPDHSAHQQGRYTEEHRIPCHPDKGDFWKPADSCQCQREDRRRTDTTSHSGKVAGRFRSAKYHRQPGNGRRSCLAGHATRYSSPQREAYFATSTDNAGIARQEMSDHELHHR